MSRPSVLSTVTGSTEAMGSEMVAGASGRLVSPSSLVRGGASGGRVMVAVMGVSVKYRDDLRQIFCDPTGRDRLKQAFAHYFELSKDRTVLARQIAESKASLADVDQALAALRTLEDV